MDVLSIDGGGVVAGDFSSALAFRPDGSVGRGDGSFVPGGPSGVGAGGVFTVECFRPDGSRRWVQDAKNAVTSQALNLILDQVLRAQSGVAQWYLGLVDNASFTAFDAADTPNSHTGWIENQDYSQSTRPAWTPGAASAATVTNGTTVDFSINANTKTIRGIFLISANDKGGGTSGQKLFSTAAFSGGNQSVNSGDTLKVTYTVSASAT